MLRRSWMKNNFLNRYLANFDSIQGFFTFDAALLLMAYNQLINANGVSGDVLEIGVHHGLSAITIASLADRAGRFIAVDLFDNQQEYNLSASGLGNQDEFLRNLRAFFDDLSFLQVFT